MSYSPNLQRWMDYFHSHDPALLEPMLADDVVFISPVVHTPQRGKRITSAYLLAAEKVLNNETFVYRRVFDCADRAVLEFELELDGVQVNGVDMVEWDAHGQITEFKVMVRPLKAVNKVHEKMGEMLAQMKGAAEKVAAEG